MYSKILFVHIAKTGGSTVNHLFAKSIGKENCSFHLESKKRDYPLDEYKFISGHLGLTGFQKRTNLDDYFKFTILRNPLEQLASHLRWIKNIELRNQFPNKSIEKLGRAIKDVSFKNPEQLDAFLSNLNPTIIHLFDNCMCRYFNHVKHGKVYTNSDYNLAIENTKLFNHIGSLEKLEQTVNYVNLNFSHYIKFSDTEIMNQNNLVERIDVNNPAIAEVLQNFTHFDMQLYNHVLNQN